MGILALVATAAGLASGTLSLAVDSEAAAQPQRVTGPGALAAGPIAYRDTHARFFSRNTFLVLFRTAQPFARRNAIGETQPGELSIGDDSDNHDGFSPIGGTVPQCYAWTLTATPTLTKIPAGERIPVRLKFPGTTSQVRSTTLQTLPRGIPRNGPEVNGRQGLLATGPLNQALHHIGC